MKTKFILGSLALASAFVGCSNEELNVVANENQSNLIELSENFMISSVGVAGVESRTHWALKSSKLTNVFAPVVAAAGAGNNVLNGSLTVNQTITANNGIVVTNGEPVIMTKGVYGTNPSTELQKAIRFLEANKQGS